MPAAGAGQTWINQESVTGLVIILLLIAHFPLWERACSRMRWVRNENGV